MAGLFRDLPRAVSMDRQIRAVEREIDMRKQVYPKRVADGRMSQQFADEEVAVMEAVLATLKRIA